MNILQSRSFKISPTSTSSPSIEFLLLRLTIIMSHLWKIRHRKKVLQNIRISVCSAILSQRFLEGPNQKYLEWETRWPKICAEIEKLYSGILCSQKVKIDLYNRIIHTFLRSRNNKCFFLQKIQPQWWIGDNYFFISFLTPMSSVFETFLAFSNIFLNLNFAEEHKWPSRKIYTNFVMTVPEDIVFRL